jgi:hypothetical protein
MISDWPQTGRTAREIKKVMAKSPPTAYQVKGKKKSGNQSHRSPQNRDLQIVDFEPVLPAPLAKSP